MFLLAASLFFTNPLPLEMPRAEAYFVREDDRLYLEDRYRRGDVWTSRAVLGRWLDDEGRLFTLARLDVAAPAVDVEETVTRRQYAEKCVPLVPKDMPRLRAAVASVSPCELPEKGVPPRQRLRGFEDVVYWQGTNASTVVCTFLPEKSPCWFLAVWELAEDDDPVASQVTFEEEFLTKWTTFGGLWKGGDPIPDDEREALRQDAHHAVTNYAGWHWTDAPEFTVLDALPANSGFVTALTNELRTLRAKCAAVLPTRIDGSNALCVARLFGSRGDYLAAVGEDLKWTAAVWDVSRRELSAYLPAAGEAELLKTVRHEAFHQYLSYACSMIPTSPWLNEGYAVYFEDAESLDWGARKPGVDELERLAEQLPAVLAMDYDEFYAGTDDERRLKYRLAWSVAAFLEQGAPKVRFEPFKRLKSDYLDALFETRDMKRATDAAFRNRDFLKKFTDEWLKFWQNT